MKQINFKNPYQVRDLDGYLEKLKKYIINEPAKDKKEFDFKSYDLQKINELQQFIRYQYKPKESDYIIQKKYNDTIKDEKDEYNLPQAPFIRR